MTEKTVSLPRGRFDFGLTDAEETRALTLHRDSTIIDLLAQHVGGNHIFDAYPTTLRAELEARVNLAGAEWERLTDAEYWPYDLSRRGVSHLVRDWYFASGVTCGTYGIGVHDGHDPLSLKLETVNRWLLELPWLKCVTSAREIREAKQQQLIALYAHWQPVTPIPKDLGAIDRAYASGLRSLMLTYNRMDNVGVGCTERVDAGLSMFGLEVVAHCNAVEMMVDVSHCGPATTLDACRASNAPVNANHTCARSLSNHARAKSDEALRAIAETGGVIGVVAVPAFISETDRPTIEHVLDHIDYIAELVGWQHVAIGSDWPMQAPHALLCDTFGAVSGSVGFRPQDRLDLTQPLIGFEDLRDFPNFTRGMVKRGYRDEQIRGILGENALRVFEQVCG